MYLPLPYTGNAMQCCSVCIYHSPTQAMLCSAALCVFTTPLHRQCYAVLLCVYLPQPHTGNAMQCCSVCIYHSPTQAMLCSAALCVFTTAPHRQCYAVLLCVYLPQPHTGNAVQCCTPVLSTSSFRSHAYCVRGCVYCTLMIVAQLCCPLFCLEINASSHSLQRIPFGNAAGWSTIYWFVSSIVTPRCG